MAIDSFSVRPIQKALDNEVERRMKRAALSVEGNAKRLLNVGQPIKRTKGGRLVGLNPSKPGEPPHTLSGRLKNSITHAISRDGGDVVARIGTNVEYARRLELGFTGTDSLGRNVNQAPRPYLRPALKLSVPAIRKAFS